MITRNQKHYVILSEEGGKKLIEQHEAYVASGASAKRREAVRKKASKLNIVNRPKGVR